MKSVATHITGGWEWLLDLVFPPRCVGCRTEGSLLCPVCLAAVPKAEPPRCPVCWAPWAGHDGPCRRCQGQQVHFRAARAAFVYRGAAREAVHALKYQGLAPLARIMAGPMAKVLAQWDPPVRAVVPVPLTGKRRRLRGYNQAELLGKEIARLTGLALAPQALRRHRSTLPQARAPGEAARWANVKGAFSLGPEGVKGPVLLVDDVLTTGATLDACARALLEGDGGPVFALAFARED